MKNIKIVHYGIHKNIIANFGDKIHFFLLRKWFDQILYPRKIKWKLKQLWSSTTRDEIKKINANYDLILIGGGGLFLKDQKKANIKNSGWQLNISTKKVEEIKTPIVIFGVGYNKFRNQGKFSKIFKKNINEIEKKTIFFGLRNYGSIKQISNFLVKKNKPIFQPCITTIIAKLNYCKKIERLKNRKKVISIGLAGDRIKNRFQNDKVFKKFTKTLNEMILILHKSNYDVHFVYHKNIDKIFEKYLTIEVKKIIKIKNFTNETIDKAIAYYKSIDLIFAMRGHNQLVAAGCMTPCYSIITHDKISYFVNENNLNFFSCDVKNKLFDKKLISFCQTLNNNQLKIIRYKLKEILNKNYKVTLANTKYITKKINF